MKKSIMGIIMIAVIVAVALGTVFFIRSDVSANNEAVITYETVKIESGDSIWSIAEEHYSEPCGSMKHYVKEIKKTNNLHSDRIDAGNYLCIPVYTSDVQ